MPTTAYTAFVAPAPAYLKTITPGVSPPTSPDQTTRSTRPPEIGSGRPIGRGQWRALPEAPT
ncbi:hypothetical protein, partial [Streptomyces sp. NRRL WC-3701]|uniref:hypothetical protein n=1 Tax=Streptomyces sp. NRRL WC-3701 TaxID=1519473 RepID=UPI001F2CE68E